jgi:hypothetical protein
MPELRHVGVETHGASVKLATKTGSSKRQACDKNRRQQASSLLKTSSGKRQACWKYTDRGT